MFANASVGAWASDPVDPASSQQSIVSQQVGQVSGIVIPATTVVHIELIEALTSKTNKIGDTFALRLSAPLIIDGRTVLPQGLAGGGEVTHAAKKGGGGKPGELIINARFLQCGGTRIALGHFHFAATGHGNFGAAFATAQVVPFGQFMVSGHDAVIPAGSTGTAQINAHTVIAADDVGRCVEAH